MLNIKILKKTIKQEQELYTLFITLANLEIEEKKDTQEYQNTLKTLQEKLKEEKNYYDTLDIEELETLIDYFEKEMEKKHLDKNLTELDKQLISARIYQILGFVLDTKTVLKEIKTILKEKELNQKNIIKYIFPVNKLLYEQYYEIIFEKFALNYRINDYIYYLNKAIEEEKDSHTKANLQIIKYYRIFSEGIFYNIQKLLPNGPLTQINHEQIQEDSNNQNANLISFMQTIEEIMRNDTSDAIDELLQIENNPASKKALIANLKATLPYLSKESLKILSEFLEKENQDTITRIKIRDMLKAELQNRSYYNVAKTENKPTIKLELTDETIELLQNLIKIEHSIYTIYMKLMENTKEFQTWLENLKDAIALETKYLSQINHTYQNVLQFAIALNHFDLQLYSETPINPVELLNIKSRINSYIKPIFDDLLTKEAYKIFGETNLVNDIKKERIDIFIVQLLAKIFSIESFKKASEISQKYSNPIKKEILSNQYEAAFTNYNFTKTLIEAKFNAQKLPEIVLQRGK